MADKLKRKPRVCIAMPVQETVKSSTAFSLVHATAYAMAENACEIDMILRKGCDIVGSRCGLVYQAREHQATHLLFVDHDMYFPPETIVRLLKRDKDIIGATYNFRTVEKKSTAFPLDGVEPKGVFKCKGIGTGLLLIKMEVFDKIDVPWFQFGRNDKGDLVYGEDSWFCQQAMKKGYDVWADDTLNVKHLGEYKF